MSYGHLDLFSGIGGFALAADRIFGDIKHTFVEWDDFCQAILKKHWPEAEIHGDIRAFVADAKRGRHIHGESKIESAKSGFQTQRESVADIPAPPLFLLTGGFPCQPFSNAGRRKGTADDRYLWPPMLECISLFRPEWVIAENVAGLATWNEGLVLETVCTDLEKEGYEVQPFVIPAVAVGAPHRRDRIWIVAHAIGAGAGSENRKIADEKRRISKGGRTSLRQVYRPISTSGPSSANTNVADSGRERRLTRSDESVRPESEKSERSDGSFSDWKRDWPEVATRLCGVFNGLSSGLDKTMSDGIYSKYAKTLSPITGQDLPCLWHYIQSEAFQWSAGRFNAVQNKDYLFTVLWKYAHRADGQDDLPFESAEVQEAFVRNVWHTDESGCPPQGWRYNEQYAQKHSDTLPQLSYEVALVAKEVWEAYLKDRNPRLKALGNAIVPQVAEMIMSRILEVESLSTSSDLQLTTSRR